VTFPWWDPTGLGDSVKRLIGAEPLLDADLEADLRVARSVLDAADRTRMAVLGTVAATAIDAALTAARPADTEDDLAAALLSRLVGVRAPVVLVAADDRIARYRHPLPGTTPIRERVMLVLVAEAWGLHVAVTRFRSWGVESPDVRRRMAAVADVQGAMAEATVPDATLGDVIVAAQAAYAAAGFPDEWRDHHQGGTIAYHGRESVATPGDTTVIRPGMAFAWNPSIAGAKAEDTFILGDDGRRRYVTGRGGS
jgi:Xaa-Pro aminopeptidase